MKKYLSNLFDQYPFASTFGLFFSIILLLFFLSKQNAYQTIKRELEGKKQDNTSFFERITGHKMNPEQGYVYESVRAFNGDGYSIWIYSLSDADAAYFMQPDTLLFSNYPIVGESRTDWKQRKWKRGPFDEKNHEYLHLALNVAGPDNESKIELREKWFGKIRSMLAEENCLYAFNFTENKPGAYPGNVDFYIISPDNNVLIIINHNT